MESGGDFLPNVSIYLVVVLLAVPLSRRMGLGPVLGYLVAGVLIGPWGLALIRDAPHIELFSRIATVLLLLLVGLEATPARVRALREYLPRFATWQYLLCVVVVTLVARVIGLPWHHALVAGIALSLSSGAIATHAFRERFPAGSPLTDAGRRLLLTQSLAMVPIIVFLPLLGFEAAITEGSAWPRVVAALMVIALVVAIDRFALPQAFRLVAATGLDEVFAAFALLLVIGLLQLVRWLGLPLELGALLAGMLLARSEYGSAITIALRPFAGLLTGLFFLAVGMQVDFARFIAKPAETLALVVLLVVVRTWFLRAVLRRSLVPRPQRVWLATVLSQGGELGFVVLVLASATFAVPSDLAGQLVLVIALSMFVTPALLLLAERRDTLPAQQQGNTGLEPGARADSQVVIAGFGRVGRVIARVLGDNGFRVAIIDHDPDRFAALRAGGFVGFYGDALRPDLLEAAGAASAVIMVVAIDDAERAEELVRRVRRAHPHLTVVARAVDEARRARLLASGAERAYLETFESALLMGEDVLDLIGVGPIEAQALIESFRDAEESRARG